jgi:hypothetical protein
MDFEALSVDSAKKAQHDAEVAKKRHSKEITDEAKGTGANALATPSFVSRVQALIPKAPRGRPPKRKPNDTEDEQPDPKRVVEDEKIRHAELYARYVRYAQSTEPKLREAVGGVAPNPRWSLAEVQSNLDRVRSHLDSSGAEASIKMGVVAVARGLEWVTMTAGVNPTREDLNGFGNTMETIMREEPHLFQPELAEMQAEIGSLITTPWQARLMMKMAQAVRAYSARGGAPFVPQQPLGAPSSSSDKTAPPSGQA